MTNAWKTQWEEDSRRRAKRFEGDSPSPAVSFGKGLKRRGIDVVDVISTRSAFPPPLKHLSAPKPGLLWCPYCVKWREFEEAEVVFKDFRTPPLMRCTTCTISIKDAYVRKYNPELVIKYELQMEDRQRKREAAKEKRRQRQKMNPFRSQRR